MQACMTARRGCRLAPPVHVAPLSDSGRPLATAVSDVALGVVFAWTSVQAYWALNEVSREMEEPYSCPPNDIPLSRLQFQFNERCLAFLRTQVRTTTPDGPPAGRRRPPTAAGSAAHALIACAADPGAGTSSNTRQLRSRFMNAVPCLPCRCQAWRHPPICRTLPDGAVGHGMRMSDSGGSSQVLAQCCWSTTMWCCACDAVRPSVRMRRSMPMPEPPQRRGKRRHLQAPSVRGLVRCRATARATLLPAAACARNPACRGTCQRQRRSAFASSS